MASIFVATVLGETFVHSAEQELNLAEIIANEVCSCYVSGIWYHTILIAMHVCIHVHVYM